METSIGIACGIDGCTGVVWFYWDNGETQTYDYPGYPGSWLCEIGCGGDEHTDIHCNNDDQMNNDDARLSMVAATSFDNDIWDY